MTISGGAVATAAGPTTSNRRPWTPSADTPNRVPTGRPCAATTMIWNNDEDILDQELRRVIQGPWANRFKFPLKGHMEIDGPFKFWFRDPSIQDIYVIRVATAGKDGLAAERNTCFFAAYTYDNGELYPFEPVMDNKEKTRKLRAVPQADGDFRDELVFKLVLIR